MKIPNIDQSDIASAYSHISKPDRNEEEINLIEYKAVLLENKWNILIVTVLASLLGVAYCLFAEPVYQTNTLLQIEKKQSSALGALDDLVNPMESKRSSSDAEIAILRSRSILSTAVNNLSLDIIAKPIYFPMIGKGIARRFVSTEQGVARTWFGLPQYDWGAISVETLQVPPHFLNKPLILEAGQSSNYRLFDSENQLLLQGRVGQRAEKVWSGGEKIRLFVSALKARPGTHFQLMRFSVQQATNRVFSNFSVVEQGNKTGILYATYTGPDSMQITKVLNEIANLYVRQSVERKSEGAKKSLAFLDKQLPPLKHKVDLAEAAYNEYRIRHGSVDMTEEARIVLTNNVKVDTEIITHKQELEGLVHRFKPTHPLVRGLKSKIALLQRKQKVNDKKAEKLPATQQEILRLARVAQSAAALYGTLINTAQQLRVAQASTVGDVRIIDHAINPEKSIKPKKKVIVFIAMIGGLFLGILLAFLRRAIHNGVDNPDELERQLGLPVYASVLHSDKQAKMNQITKSDNAAFGILAHNFPTDQAIESLLSLQTALHFTLMAAKNNILLVTGPSPGVGKTFVALNLGAVFAKNGKSVVVLDADLRRGTLHRYLGISRNNGLSEMIVGDDSAPISFRNTQIENLQVITTGVLPPNPAELLLHESFGKRLEQLSGMVDVLIVDAPPILAVTDPAIIGRYAATILMVCKAGRHPMRELEQSVKRLQHAGVHVNGWVFNDLDISSSRYKYSEYVYHYEYAK